MGLQNKIIENQETVIRTEKRRFSLLLVDDEQFILKLIEEFLKPLGHRYTVAGNAEEARQHVNEQNFELVLCDINMPGESGLEFSKFVLSKYPDTAVVVVTGINDPLVASETLEIGVYDYITKPLERNQVLISVTNALRRRELEIENRDYRDRLEIQVRSRTETLHKTVEDLEKTQLALVESESKYRELVQNANSIILKLDIQGRIIFFNEFSQNFFGYTEHEVLDQSVIGTIVPETESSGRDLRTMIRDIVQEPEGYRRNEHENMKRNGQRVWVAWTNKAIADPDGNITSILCIGTDISERKQAELALRESEEKFRQISACAQEAIIMMDPEAKVSYWNAAAEKMFGYPAVEAMNKDLHALIAPRRYHDEFLKNFAHFRESGQGPAVGQMIEVTAKRNDGNEFPIELSLSAMKLKGRWHALGIIRDISERRVLEAQLLQAQKLESIGQLAAGIAHEINTPTQYVSYNTRFLQEQFELLDPLFDQYRRLFEAVKAGPVPDDIITEIDGLNENIDLSFVCKEIPSAIEQSLEGVERVSEIVRAMKEFSHPGTGEKTPLDINRAIQSTITVARNEWKYVAEVETRLDQNMPLVLCLPGDFNQVILNIIINAAHAIANVVNEGADQKGTITVSTGCDDGWAEIRIRDTGSGISEAHRPRIFDPFFTTKEAGRGTGQGLAISHSVIVKKHGGTLHFETEAGKSTTFIIRLPLK